MHVLGAARHTSTHAADAAHDHVHTDTRTAGLADLVDDLRVVDGVVFQDDGRGLALHGQRDLAVHFLEQHGLEAQRCDQHRVCLARQALQGHVVKDGAGLLADLLSSRDEGQVGVQLACLFIIVAGADLRQVLILAVDAAGDKGQLGMDLVIVEAVEHSAARVLELLGPVDVVLLVKAGAQLDHRDDLLAVLGSGDQGVHDLGVAGHAVERHFDRHNVGVSTRAQQHLDKRANALVRVGQQHVMLADLGVQVVPCRGLHGLCRGIEQRRVAAVSRDAPGQLEQRAGVERRRLGITAIRGHDELVPQEFDDLLRGVRPELQAHSRELTALFQQLAHDIAEIDVVIHHALVHRDVRVAGHAEQALLLHRAGAENRRGIVGDQLLHKGKAGRLAVLDKEHPLKLAADRHDAVADALIFGVELGNIVNVLVVQERERVAGIDDLRAEQRQQLALEVGFPEMLLRLGELGEVYLFVALLRQRRDKVLEVFITFCLQFRHARRDGSDLLRRRHVGDVVGLIVFEQRLVVERADADHEELVHIAAEDSSKLDAFAQRHGLFLGKGQHPAVEVKPAEFTVDEDAFRLFFQVYLLLMIGSGQARPAFCHAQGYALYRSGVRQRGKRAVRLAVGYERSGLPGAKARQGGQFLRCGRVDVDEGRCLRLGSVYRRRDIRSGRALRLPDRSNEEQRPRRDEHCGQHGQHCQSARGLHGRFLTFRLLNFNYSIVSQKIQPILRNFTQNIRFADISGGARRAAVRHRP